MVHFGLYPVLHILKPIVPADNSSYQKRSFEHPTRRQIFANTVGRICKLNLTVRHIFLFPLSILFHFDRPNIFLHFSFNPSSTKHFPSLKMSIFSLSHLMARVVMITRRRSAIFSMMGTQSKYGKSRSAPPSEEVAIIVCSIRGHIMWRV